MGSWGEVVLADIVARSGSLDQLLGLARKAFFIVVPEVERTGRIGSPFMMTLGSDGFDIGRLITDGPEELFATTVRGRKRPGVVAYTRGPSLFLAVMDVEGLLVRVEVPFSFRGRRFPDPPPALFSELFDPSYDGRRVVRYLLPLEGTTGADHDVDPSTLAPVLLPDTAGALADMVRLQKLMAQPDPQPAGVFLAELEEERRATAPEGLLAVFQELASSLGERAGAHTTYVTKLKAARSPLLAGLAQRARLEDAASRPLGADPQWQEKVLGDLRAAFAFVPGGVDARVELVGILREAFGDDADARAAVDRMDRRLDLARAAAAFRGCRRLAIVVGLLALVCSGWSLYRMLG